MVLRQTCWICRLIRALQKTLTWIKASIRMCILSLNITKVMRSLAIQHLVQIDFILSMTPMAPFSSNLRHITTVFKSLCRVISKFHTDIYLVDSNWCRSMTSKAQMRGLARWPINGIRWKRLSDLKDRGTWSMLNSVTTVTLNISNSLKSMPSAMQTHLVWMK